MAIIWTIWNERNARIFEGKSRQVEEVMEIAFYYSALWALNSKEFKI